MMNHRRNKIFKAFSDNLWLVLEKLNIKLGIKTNDGIKDFNKPIYICPLCKNVFSEESLQQKYSNPLTIEDVPPKSLKGKPLILTCKNCNNNAGTKLDKALINHLKEAEFLKLKPYGEVRAILSFNDYTPISTKIRIRENKEWFFQVNTKNPNVIKQFEELKMNWDKTNIHIEFKTTKKDFIISALLRIGYLIAFNYFGNQILFENNIQKLIDQINHPKIQILPHSSVSELNLSNNAKDGLHIITCPKYYKSYFSIFTLKLDKIIRQFGVYIPGPGIDGWKYYEKLKDFKHTTEMKFHDISFKDMIKNKNMVDGYIQIWSHF